MNYHFFHLIQTKYKNFLKRLITYDDPQKLSCTSNFDYSENQRKLTNIDFFDFDMLK